MHRSFMVDSEFSDNSTYRFDPNALMYLFVWLRIGKHLLIIINYLLYLHILSTLILFILFTNFVISSKYNKEKLKKDRGWKLWLHLLKCNCSTIHIHKIMAGTVVRLKRRDFIFKARRHPFCLLDGWPHGGRQL